VLTVDDVAEALGISKRQAYRRISAARQLLAPYIRSGQKGAILLDGNAIEILRRLEDLRRQGVATEEAIEMVAEEMGRAEEKKENSPQPDVGAWGLLVAEKDRRIAQLESEVNFLRSQVAHLQDQISTMMPLALKPPPKPPLRERIKRVFQPRQ